jgi:transcriptional regulator with XRE-family HTH domain
LARKKYTEVERNIMEEVSKNLKRVSKYKGLSQKDICDATDLPTSTISDYVNARTLISMGNLNKIAEALKVFKGEIYPVEPSGNESSIHNKNSNPLANEKEFSSDLLDKIKHLADKHNMDLTDPSTLDLMDSAFDFIKRMKSK